MKNNKTVGTVVALVIILGILFYLTYNTPVMVEYPDPEPPFTRITDDPPFYPSDGFKD